jgi:hypothetical protein
MKSQRHKILIFFGLAMASFAFITHGITLAPEKASSEASKQLLLDWNLKTSVGAYESVGNTNSAWDEPAQRALKEFAQHTITFNPLDPQSEQIIATNSAAAVTSGCNDPMVRYLFARFYMSQTNSPEEIANTLCTAALDLQKSSYPPDRKFFATIRAIDASVAAHGFMFANQMPTVKELYPYIETNLLAVLNDKTTPPEEVYEASAECLRLFVEQPNIYVSFYSVIEPRLLANWPDEPTSWLLKGKACIDMAWFARGNGMSTVVTTDGLIKFSRYLAVAESALNHAWNLNTNDARIADEMIRLEAAQRQGRDRMELWFNRAIGIDPNDYIACAHKLNYLEPNWYGSIEEMLKFGHECTTNSSWGGRVPIILVDVHDTIFNSYIDKTARAGYWKQPEVWQDIKTAYTRYFELNPKAADNYKNYALRAYNAEQWATFVELSTKVNPADYAFFESKNNFNSMVRYARQMIQSGKKFPVSTNITDLASLASLEILSAKFGSGTNVINVKETVIELLQASADGFRVNAGSLGGDPSPGVKKQLTIEYNFTGTNYVLTVPRGGQVNNGILIEHTHK